MAPAARALESANIRHNRRQVIIKLRRMGVSHPSDFIDNRVVRHRLLAP